MKINLLRRTILLMLCVFLSAIAAVANVTHVVNRGETIQSIAQRYGLTPEQIIQANPQAAQFIYVGMELSIPVQIIPVTSDGVSSGSNPVPTAGVVPTTNSENNTRPLTTGGDEKVEDSRIMSQGGISYIANFDAGGKGYYGLCCDIISNSGVGYNFFYGFSYGIVDDGGMLIRVGPSFGGWLGESILWSMPIDLGAWDYNSISEMYFDRDGNRRDTENMKIGFSISLTPKLTVRTNGPYCFNFGLDLNYNFGRTLKTKISGVGMDSYTQEIKIDGKAFVGFTVGIAYDAAWRSTRK